MTDQHPLTDKICCDLINDVYFDFIEIKPYMQAAADWQLEQVIEWIIDNRDGYVDENRLLDALKKAMRPQQQQETP